MVQSKSLLSAILFLVYIATATGKPLISKKGTVPVPLFKSGPQRRQLKEDTKKHSKKPKKSHEPKHSKKPKKNPSLDGALPKDGNKTLSLQQNCTIDEDCSADYYCASSLVCCEFNTTCPAMGGAGTSDGSTRVPLFMSTVAAVAGGLVALFILGA